MTDALTGSAWISFWIRCFVKRAVYKGLGFLARVSSGGIKEATAW